MSDNRDYVCIIPERVMFDLTLSLLDLRVYGLVSSFMYTTGKFYEGNRKMATRFGVEMRSIPRSIARLVEKGYLDTIVINGKRHLIIKQTPMPEATVSYPEHDTSVTPPMTRKSPPHDTEVIQSLPVINTNSDKNILREKEMLDEIFESMWETYPLKKGKQNARAAFFKVFGSKHKADNKKLMERLAEGFTAHIAEHQAKKDLESQGAKIWVPELPYLSTWINQGRWEDSYSSPQDILAAAKPKSGILDINTVF